MPKKTTKKVAVKVNVSKSIRDALAKLGIDASARDVAAEVSGLSVEHAAKVTATGKLWDNYVSMQRARIRGGGKGRRGASAAGGEDLTVSVGNLQALAKLAAHLKNPSEIAHFVAAVTSFGSPKKIALVLQKFADLQKKFDDVKKIEAFLADVEAVGLR